VLANKPEELVDKIHWHKWQKEFDSKRPSFRSDELRSRLKPVLGALRKPPAAMCGIVSQR
jgi:hypothetical protein